jgi:hypothetical protein
VSAPAGDGGGNPQVVVVGRHFKMIFLAVVSLTVGMILLDVALSVFVDDPNEHVVKLIDMCDFLAKLGFGAIIGLVGGKAA